MTINFNVAGVPQELQIYRQWVVWKFEVPEAGKKPTKVPYNVKTGQRASALDRFSWATFGEVVGALHKYDGIGFVLTKEDPYCVMDLDTVDNEDDKARLIRYYNTLNSFTEISPSGTGSHIWIKGEVPRGVNARPFEIYSYHRFITVTGNVHYNAAIEHRQVEIDSIYSELNANRASIVCTYDGTDPALHTDQQIIDKAAGAKNGYKFIQLWHGAYTEWYSSQSEADFALVDILAYYTQNSEQLARLFRFSELGKREKALRDDYMQIMISKSFDKLPPKVNLDIVAQSVEMMKEALMKERENAPTLNDEIEKLVESSQALLPTNHVEKAIEQAQRQSWLNDAVSVTSAQLYFPQGLVGDIADYIYRSAPRSVVEVALTAAIGLMAGICGSSFNVSGQGLNQYILIIASSGMGKENMTAGISRLLSQVKMITPNCMSFVAASNISSPQAIFTYLNSKCKSALFMMGEAGHRLQSMADPRAPSAITDQKRVFLELYGKSGRHDILHPTIYADMSKNTMTIQSPAVTLVGDTTHASFFNNVDENIILDGFIPRWLMLEYEGLRPPLNESASAVFPSAQLIQNLASLCFTVHSMLDSGAVLDVGYANEEVREEVRSFNGFCDAQYNATGEESLRTLWTRVYLKALKLAALCAVGRNYSSPSISMDDWNFAKLVVLKDTYRLCRLFSTGTLSLAASSEILDQYAHFKRCLRTYLIDGATSSDKSYGVTPKMRSSIVVPYSYLSRKLTRVKAFDKSKRGASQALQQTIRDMELSGVIIALPPNQALAEFNTSGRLWSIADPMALTTIANSD